MGYIDEQAYLGGSFRPERVANQIVRTTTTRQDARVDLAPALKLVGFDLTEATQAVASAARSNTGVLVDHASTIDHLRSQWQPLRPALDNARATQNRLNRDFTRPYQRARALTRAAAALHAVSTIVRPLSEVLELSSVAEDASLNLATRASAVVRRGDIWTSHPGLAQVSVAKTIAEADPKLRKDLMDAAKAALSESLADTTALEAVVALEPTEARTIVEERAKALVSNTVSQLSRSVASSTTLEQALGDAHARAASIATAHRTVDSGVIFWDAVATQLDHKLRTMSVANPGVIKALNQNRERVLAVSERVPVIHDVLDKFAQ